MTTANFVAELYRELEWRLDEIQQLKNMIAYEPGSDARDGLRKSVLVVLYAHFEGFCVFAMQHYLAAVNKAGLRCREAVSAVLAGAWEPVFNAMEHGDQKSRVFRHSLPNDARLHRHWRRRHFVEEIDRMYARPVSIPEDVVDTESNLKPSVLQRNLFVLGLDHSFVDPYTDTISQLLGRRNRIAHGDDRRGISEREYSTYETAVGEICLKLIEFMEENHSKQRFCRSEPEYTI